MGKRKEKSRLNAKLDRKVDHDKTPPWEGASTLTRQMPLYLSVRTKAQLDYIKQQTQVPTQAWLRSQLTGLIEKEAKRLWKEMPDV